MCDQISIRVLLDLNLNLMTFDRNADQGGNRNVWQRVRKQ